MFLNPPPFPDDLVGLYPQIADEPEFRPVDHLALESGGDRISLDALGYLPEDLNGLPTDCAAVGPFRVLSPAGVEALRTVALAFRKLDLLSLSDFHLLLTKRMCGKKYKNMYNVKLIES